MKFGSKNYNGWVEERSNGSSIKDYTEIEHIEDNLLLPPPPVQRIVGIIGRLRCQHNMSVLVGAMLEAAGDRFAMCSFVIQNDGRRNVGKFVIL
jgi:hypothetical protein